MSPAPIIHEAGPDRLADCFPLMRQLRPHLGSVEEFVTRVRHQSVVAGYRLLVLRASAQEGPLALAGYRFQDNLVHGRHCYVDDLVTSDGARGHGHGRRLLDHLAGIARTDGCAKLLLDTPLANSLGHRFYFRAGLLATALRFTWML
jgi:ribosomal protein S18 acetylase RimI-like enzyme